MTGNFPVWMKDLAAKWYVCGNVSVKVCDIVGVLCVTALPCFPSNVDKLSST